MSHILFVAVGQCTKDLKHELCSFPFFQIIMRIQVFEKFSTGNPIFLIWSVNFLKFNIFTKALISYTKINFKRWSNKSIFLNGGSWENYKREFSWQKSAKIEFCSEIPFLTYKCCVYPITRIFAELQKNIFLRVLCVKNFREWRKFNFLHIHFSNQKFSFIHFFFPTSLTLHTPRGYQRGHFSYKIKWFFSAINH